MYGGNHVIISILSKISFGYLLFRLSAFPSNEKKNQRRNIQRKHFSCDVLLNLLKKEKLLITPAPSTQVLDRNRDLACGLLAIGVSPGNETHIGLFATNAPECIIAEMGCYYFSMVLVPLYDSMGMQSVNFIIDQAQIQTVICDSVERVSDPESSWS